MFELLIDILPVILLITMGISFWVGRKKGYSGIILALISFVFPIMAIIVFFLPDRNEMKRNAEEYRIRAGQESLELRAKQEFERMSVDELCSIAIEHANNGNDERALAFFEKAAEHGYMKAQHVCGIWYEEGRGCTFDYEKALYWYKQAAEQGFVKSQLCCAELYAGKLHDQENALYWYRKAAEQGDTDAQRMLDDMNAAKSEAVANVQIPTSPYLWVLHALKGNFGTMIVAEVRQGEISVEHRLKNERTGKIYKADIFRVIDDMQNFDENADDPNAYTRTVNAETVGFRLVVFHVLGSCDIESNDWLIKCE